MSLPFVTDHALLRYLERARGINVELIREHIALICAPAANVGCREPAPRRREICVQGWVRRHRDAGRHGHGGQRGGARMSEKPDLELMKRQIEAQVDDYERAIEAYAAFMEDWRRRNPPREAAK